MHVEVHRPQLHDLQNRLDGVRDVAHAAPGRSGFAGRSFSAADEAQPDAARREQTGHELGETRAHLGRVEHVKAAAIEHEVERPLRRIGQEVAIKVDAFPDVEFRGRVDSIQRGAGQAFSILPPQNATGNFVKVVQRVPVRITFLTGKGYPDPRNYPIGPGMSVVPTVKVR